MPAGRPTDYSLELAAEICARLAEGQSLAAMCRDDPDMPSVRSVYLWLTLHEEFSQMYARAREDQADTLADQILDIADTPVEGTTTKITVRGTETTTGDMIEHRRLQVDARKWIAAKLKPRKYSERLMQELTGKDGGPIQTKESASEALDKTSDPTEAMDYYTQIVSDASDLQR